MRYPIAVLAVLAAVAGTFALGGAATGSHVKNSNALCHDPTIQGGSGGQTLIGTPGDDVIRGGKGPDIIKARGGDDRVCGGKGPDIIRLGRGRDKGQGNHSGADRIIGGPGFDTAKGGQGGNDLCRAEREHSSCEH